MRRVHIGNRRGAYRYVARDPYSPRGEPSRIEYIRAEDVAGFSLEPPFARVTGKPRLKEAHRAARKDKRIMDALWAAAHAEAFPEDRRWWVERARWLDSAKLYEELDHLALRIRSILGGAVLDLSRPTTRFYGVYDVIAFRWRLARLRESLVRQFNDVIVTPLLEHNGLPRDSARLSIGGLRCSEDWMNALQRLNDGSMTCEEAGQFVDPGVPEFIRGVA